jgi:hypothetical protein
MGVNPKLGFRAMAEALAPAPGASSSVILVRERPPERARCSDEELPERPRGSGVRLNGDDMLMR